MNLEWLNCLFSSRRLEKGCLESSKEGCISRAELEITRFCVPKKNGCESYGESRKEHVIRIFVHLDAE